MANHLDEAGIKAQMSKKVGVSTEKAGAAWSGQPQNAGMAKNPAEPKPKKVGVHKRPAIDVL